MGNSHGYMEHVDHPSDVGDGEIYEILYIYDGSD